MTDFRVEVHLGMVGAAGSSNHRFRQSTQPSTRTRANFTDAQRCPSRTTRIASSLQPSYVASSSSDRHDEDARACTSKAPRYTTKSLWSITDLQTFRIDNGGVPTRRCRRRLKTWECRQKRQYLDFLTLVLVLRLVLQSLLCQLRRSWAGRLPFRRIDTRIPALEVCRHGGQILSTCGLMPPQQITVTPSVSDCGIAWASACDVLTACCYRTYALAIAKRKTHEGARVSQTLCCENFQERQLCAP